MLLQEETGPDAAAVTDGEGGCPVFSFHWRHRVRGAWISSRIWDGTSSGYDGNDSTFSTYAFRIRSSLLTISSEFWFPGNIQTWIWLQLSSWHYTHDDVTVSLQSPHFSFNDIFQTFLFREAAKIINCCRKKYKEGILDDIMTMMFMIQEKEEEV